MGPMDADVADAQDEDGNEEDRVALVDRQKRKEQDRQRRAGQGNPQHAAVEVFHPPLTFEITDPKHFIEHHQHGGDNQPDNPPLAPALRRCEQSEERHQNLSDPFQNQQYLVLILRIFFIVLRHPLRPKEIGNEEHQQEDDADV